MLNNNVVTFQDADETCRSEGSHLVSVKTISEAATVWVLVLESGLDEAWLGLRYYQVRESCSHLFDSEQKSDLPTGTWCKSE